MVRGLEKVNKLEKELQQLYQLNELLTTRLTSVVDNFEGLENRLFQKLEDRLSQYRPDPTGANPLPNSDQSASNPNRTTSHLLSIKLDLDRTHQAQLSHTLRFTGVPQEQNENVTQKVIEVCNSVGINITNDNIVEANRLRRPSNNQHQESNDNNRQTSVPGPIIVRLTSKILKLDLLKKSRALKNNNNFKRVYIKEELTPLRWKYYHYCRNLRVTNYVTSRGGTVTCFTGDNSNTNDRPKPIFINTPQDLLKLGVNNIDYEALGLSEYLLAE